ncbi:NTP transferase domain-containing protein [Ornithinimicrobium sp. W1679]|uniref:NTP transferase domain-containing protein n=1 Tax=Ornithinimicrobium sp. W1679 TaxID=3418770 RepID=UPI003CF08468
MPIVDLLVLAGGRGSRLGGRDKGALVVEGRPLLDRVLSAAPVLGGRVVVVGRGPVPEGVLRTLEDPPDGGPVAGIAAGLAALGTGSDWVAVVAVDQPGAAPAVAALHAELTGLTDVEVGDEPDEPDEPNEPNEPDEQDEPEKPDVGAGDRLGEVDALAHVDATGHRQWLLGIYRREALRAALERLPAVRDVPVRRLVADLRWHEVRAGSEHLGDVDTWADLADWERRGGSATMGRDRPETMGRDRPDLEG